MTYLSAVYTYHDPDNFRSAYRGYVKEYTNSPRVYIHKCPDVHYSKLQAKKDAEKLAKKLKHETHQLHR